MLRRDLIFADGIWTLKNSVASQNFTLLQYSVYQLRIFTFRMDLDPTPQLLCRRTTTLIPLRSSEMEHLKHTVMEPTVTTRPRRKTADITITDTVNLLPESDTNRPLRELPGLLLYKLQMVLFLHLIDFIDFYRMKCAIKLD